MKLVLIPDRKIQRSSPGKSDTKRICAGENLGFERLIKGNLRRGFGLGLFFSLSPDIFIIYIDHELHTIILKIT